MNTTTESPSSVSSSERVFLILTGLVQMALGVFAITLSVATTYFSVLILAFVLVGTGILDLINVSPQSSEHSFWWRLGNGILTIVIGLMILLLPALSVLVITALIGFFLVSMGIFRGISGSILRFRNWGWVVFSGIVSIFLGAFILSQLPVSSLWLIGTLVGVEILVHGWSLLMLGMIPRLYYRKTVVNRSGKMGSV